MSIFDDRSTRPEAQVPTVGSKNWEEVSVGGQKTIAEATEAVSEKLHALYSTVDTFNKRMPSDSGKAATFFIELPQVVVDHEITCEEAIFTIETKAGFKLFNEINPANNEADKSNEQDMEHTGRPTNRPSGPS